MKPPRHRASSAPRPTQTTGFESEQEPMNSGDILASRHSPLVIGTQGLHSFSLSPRRFDDFVAGQCGASTLSEAVAHSRPEVLGGRTGSAPSRMQPPTFRRKSRAPLSGAIVSGLLLDSCSYRGETTHRDHLANHCRWETSSSRESTLSGHVAGCKSQTG